MKYVFANSYAMQVLNTAVINQTETRDRCLRIMGHDCRVEVIRVLAVGNRGCGPD